MIETEVRRYGLSHLDYLEAEAIFIIREIVAENESPAMLFSGGKDSAVMLHLAAKAFAPASIPFPVVHIDTGHNFDEVLDFRDRRVAVRCQLIHLAQQRSQFLMLTKHLLVHIVTLVVVVHHIPFPETI